MPSLPDTLKSRFYLYLNVMPVVDGLAQVALFVGGIVLLIVAIVRASMRFSQNMQPSHKISNRRRYSSIGRGGGGGEMDEMEYGNLARHQHDDCECGDGGGGGDGGHIGGDDNLSYEMTEKCIRNSGGGGILYEVSLADEKEYMLEQEHAISEDYDNESDTKTVSYGEVEDESSSSAPSSISSVPHLVSIFITSYYSIEINMLHLMTTYESVIFLLGIITTYL